MILLRPCLPRMRGTSKVIQCWNNRNEDILINFKMGTCISKRDQIKSMQLTCIKNDGSDNLTGAFYATYVNSEQ